MIDFRSDTVTRPTPAMKQAMFDAPLGDDVFGDDPTVLRLQQLAADMLGFEAGLFMPSGTQSNLAALMTHCRRGEEAIVGQQWHTYRWEAGGMAVLGSIQPQPLPHRADGTIAPDDIEAAIKPDDPHFARTRLVVIENTHHGRLLPLSYMREVRALAQRRGLQTHIDGARIFNAAVAHAAEQGTDPMAAARELCQGYDSMSVCLSKGLGAPVGSVLLGTRAF
ncbi:MAG TPA: GntG family PLP-dependent aldolase, partial [Paucimonas sp.]|nr:GntG family PLP-dependent aldolase [Paucimonas sp.]